ncbi:MAG: CDP-alcohol phosphatidyltransferase [Hyphomicrobiales bacterium]|jgi:cardiolipin synthase|nr:CDP-alcohol phosphatidyltransferase [Hyphomicrobiales bacterium]
MLICSQMSVQTLLANLPNLITLARLALVPVVIALIVQPKWGLAFGVFMIAGISDAVDGWLAKKLDLRSELGAWLDPLADKALLVSIYIALAIAGVLPALIAILVVSRDVMIIAGVVVAILLDRPFPIKPLLISKINTTLQIAFACAVLAAKAFDIHLGLWFEIAIWLVAAFTLASAAAYVSQWLRHMEN